MGGQGTIPIPFIRLFDRLESLCRNHDRAADAEAVSLLYGMIAACRPTSPIVAVGTLASRVRNFMFDELELAFNINQIAEFFGVSRSSLFLHFMANRDSLWSCPLKLLTSFLSGGGIILMRPSGNVRSHAYENIRISRA